MKFASAIEALNLRKIAMNTSAVQVLFCTNTHFLTFTTILTTEAVNFLEHIKAQRETDNRQTIIIFVQMEGHLYKAKKKCPFL